MFGLPDFSAKPVAMSSCCDTSCDWDRICRVDSCGKKHAYFRRGEVKVYSEFCVEHTCRFCLLSDSMCRKPKDARHRFCSTHRKCGVAKCANKGDCPLGGALPWTCPSHSCRADKCSKQRHDHYGYCKDHRCLVVNCYERRAADEEYCVDHVSRVCREEDCREHVHASSLCISHQKCPIKDCKHFRHRHKDGLWDHCETHHKDTRCTFKDCKSQCLPNCKFCGAHKCTFEGCTNSRDNEKDAEKLFCRDHGCEATRCYAVAILVKKDLWAPYCRRHTCTVKDCREVCEGSKYCDRHCCTWDACDKERLDGGSLCTDHECKREGCRNKCKLPLGFCEEHCCKIDKCLNFNDTGSDKLCYEHSQKELHKKVKHLEDRLKGRGYDLGHYDDLKGRYEKLVREHEVVCHRLHDSKEEVRILRITCEEENRGWRKDLEGRGSRLLSELKREQERVAHWERKAGELLRRVDDLERLLAEERLRHPSTEALERKISDLLCKVDELENKLRCERENHRLHEGRRGEVDKLLRTVALLEKKLADECVRSGRVDELIKKVDILQSMLAGEREQKQILLDEIAKRDDYGCVQCERDGRRRFRRGSWERRSRPFTERVYC
ncbi:hypothetical protein C8035_v010255 [Colletotrichum spinosum]|uniref:Uncharacterized protein n=1 Tax=Colletotrichum spinosum TaxID=1347390 RepID=A0A4R8Q892_9PEZI|nr:hypothetical protein C8035_v010255 [Colletotrichum spinosum]